MTPTPAELALWRALNREPEGRWKQLGSAWQEWDHRRGWFATRHPADRLAYFEGKVRERGLHISSIMEDRWTGEFFVLWRKSGATTDASAKMATEHLARFHASARALAALGVITDDVMKEIETWKSVT